MLKPQIGYEVPAELDDGFDATFDRLCRWFRARGVGREEAADMAQDAIVRALVHLRRHGLAVGSAGADPLLNTIGRNLLIDRVRSLAPAVVPIEDAEALEEPFDPTDELDRAAARRAVMDAIGSLSERHQRAMLLTLEGLTPAEIAAHFGIQRNAADALLHRARRKLADQLRTTAGAMLGLWVLLGLKLRAGMRRTAIAVRHLETPSSGMLANLSTAAVAIGLMATAPVLPSGTASPVPEVRAAKAAAIVATRDVRVVEVVEPATPAATVEQVNEVRVGRTYRDPVTGDEQEASLGLWHEPGENGDRGVTGEIISGAVDTTCATAPTLCGESG